MTDRRSVAAIEASDTDELIRIVDGHVAARSWDDMVELRRRCEEAVTRGKQLWGVSEYIRYRLALDAPPAWAGPAVTEGRARFTLGPLPEVAASTKSWAELDPHLDPGPERALTAHERTVRGEDLAGVEVDPLVVELPLTLQEWEPTYQLAVYHPDRVECPAPRHASPVPGPVTPGPVVGDPEGRRALEATVEHWVEASNGRAQAVCVEGRASEAVAALGVSRAGLSEVEPSLGLAWLAWAASVGGAHGRRRGAAAGRFAAWWVAHELAGMEWPPDPDGLGEAVESLRWHLWSDGSPATGWWLRLAVESPSEGLAWALTAVDAE